VIQSLRILLGMHTIQLREARNPAFWWFAFFTSHEPAAQFAQEARSITSHPQIPCDFAFRLGQSTTGRAHVLKQGALICKVNSFKFL
jgi:hypothetical protein